MNVENLHCEISKHECIAMRELYRGDYTHGELAFMFECKEGTVAKHVNTECPHNEGTNGATIGNPKRKWSDEELLVAYRRVYDRQPLPNMSRDTYHQYKHKEEPGATTIYERFGSWYEARKLAHDK